MSSSPSPIFGTGFINNATNPGSTQFVDSGYPSSSYITMASALVFLMTPGLGLFYSGLSRSKNALSLIMICMLALAVVTLQWVLFGFSLSFSESGGVFIGNFDLAGMTKIGADALPLTAPAVPSIVFALYQLQFATITAALIFGSTAERLRMGPAMVFVFIWTTLVYDFVAYWTFSAKGWLKNLACLADVVDGKAPCALGSLDFAGGGPVHIASGFAGLAFCMFLGKRKGLAEPHKPHNMTNVFLGTALLWFGWYGFNGGSSITSTARGGMAAFVTTVSAACGGLSWTIFDYVRSKKFSGLGFCSGAVAGLVGITPGAGYVAPWAAIIIGFTSGIVCSFGCKLKDSLGYDDSLDAFGVHGVGGLWGCILTGVFAQEWIGKLDGTTISVGWVHNNWVQVGYQVAGAVVIAVWSFVITFAILFIMDKIPGLHFRPSETEELIGNDLGQMGESAYELVATDVPLASMADKEKAQTDQTVEMAENKA